MLNYQRVSWEISSKSGRVSIFRGAVSRAKVPSLFAGGFFVKDGGEGLYSDNSKNPEKQKKHSMVDPTTVNKQLWPSQAKVCINSLEYHYFVDFGCFPVRLHYYLSSLAPKFYTNPAKSKELTLDWILLEASQVVRKADIKEQAIVKNQIAIYIFCNRNGKKTQLGS